MRPVAESMMLETPNRQTFLVALLLVCFSGAVHAETGQMPDPKAVALGKPLYEQYCQACHKKDGVGQTPVPWGIRHPDHVPAMPLNETSHAWHHSDEQLVQMMLQGLRRTKVMPAWKGVISDKEAQQIVAYIKSLWSPRIVACQGPRHMSCM
jgi:mono/diheme cytochrome c family protein